MSSKKKSSNKTQKKESTNIVKHDDNKKEESKNKKYTMNDFYNDVNSSEPNNVKAVVKGITCGIKAFADNSPHPMTKFIKETMKEIFS